jgi:hypothetical protein
MLIKSKCAIYAVLRNNCIDMFSARDAPIGVSLFEFSWLMGRESNPAKAEGDKTDTLHDNHVANVRCSECSAVDCNERASEASTWRLPPSPPI